MDVDDGRVVKGTRFIDIRDAGDPVELAARYDAEGADELVFLDITASSDDRDTTVDMVYRTAERVFIPFTVGGGIRSVEDARRMLRAGADKVSVNTAAEFTLTLSAPASSTAWASRTERIPPPIVNGMNTLSAVRRASSTIVSRSSCEAVMSRKTSSSAPSAS